MSQEKIYPKGLRVFPKHDKAPDFVIGTLIISPNELFKWMKDNEHLLTEYNGEKQMRLQLLKGDKGPYATVDTYRKEENLSKDNLPF